MQKGDESSRHFVEYYGRPVLSVVLSIALVLKKPNGRVFNFDVVNRSSWQCCLISFLLINLSYQSGRQINEGGKKQKHVKRKPHVVLYLCLENFQILIQSGKLRVCLVTVFFPLFSVFKNNFLFFRLKNLFGNSKWIENKNCSQNSICEGN